MFKTDIMEWMVKDKVLTDYLQACKEADLSNFKRDPRLTKIFEHASYEQGLDYFNILSKEAPGLLWREWNNDKKGNPVTYKYGEYNFSPSTLQYIYVMYNIEKHIPNFSSFWNIVEIGGGYGGQCRTMYDYACPAKYHIIDLPEVNVLQWKYLKNTCDKIGDVSEVDCFTQPTGEEYDLVISNYALSEIPDNTEYINEVIKKSKHGYITCNTDFVQLDFPHKRLPDIPSEKKTNYILIW